MLVYGMQCGLGKDRDSRLVSLDFRTAFDRFNDKYLIFRLQSVSVGFKYSN